MPAQPSSGGSHNTSSSDLQIASSNATVNAFLGSRQPSWLNGGSVPKSASRPPPPRQPPTQVITKQPAQTVLPSPAPSDEPSPALSTYLDSPNPRPAYLAEMHNPAPVGPSGPAGNPTIDARFVHDPTGSPRNSNGQEFLRPAFEGSRSASQSRVQSPSVASPSYPPPTFPSTLIGANDQAITVPQTGQGQGTGLPPTSMGLNEVNRLKRRRTDQQSPRPIKYVTYLPEIEQHIQFCGGDKAFSTDVERPRVQLLREACTKEDGFFLAVHQLYCLWSVSRQQIYPFLRCPPALIDRAFGVLETVLKKNQHVAAVHSTWFARFPAEINTLFNPPSTYVETVNMVAIFLEKLANHFDVLTTKTWERKYPYLVDELLFYLGCYSPVLQIIFFTASRRRLGVPDGPFGLQLEQACRQDQNEHVNKSTGFQELTPITSAGEIERRNSRLIEYYRFFVMKSTSQSPTTASNSTSDHTPSQAQSRTLLRRSVSAAVSQPVIPNQGAVPPYTPTASFLPTFPAHVPSGQSRAQPHSPMMASPPQPTPGATTPFSAQLILPSNSIPQEQVTSYPSQGGQQQSVFTQEQRLRYQQQQQQHQMRQILHQAHQVHTQQHVQPQHQAPAQQQVQAQQPVGGHPQMYISHQQPVLQAPQLQYQPLYPQQISRQNARPAQNTAIDLLNFTQAPISQQSQQRSQGYGENRSPAPRASNGIPGAPQLGRTTAGQLHQSTSYYQYCLPKDNDTLIPAKGYRIPRPEMPYDASEKKAILMSLHQAHVRSPKRVTKKGETDRFYQATKAFPVPPSFLVSSPCIQIFQFVVTEEQYVLTSGASKRNHELLPTVEHFNGSLRWRVRCCNVPEADKPVTEERWCTLDVNWPANIFMKFNGKPLDIRRQSHNGKDLATELTDMVVCGTNTLQVVLPQLAGHNSSSRFLAVEMLETLSHSNLVGMVWEKGVLPESHTLQIIKSRLTGSGDDEGILFDNPTLSIDLADPFTSVIFKIPARGSACTHMECFDLETWLNTRPSKKPALCSHRNVKCDCRTSVEPSNPDKWRCPITGCPQDARPYGLRIDEFLLKVRKQLELEGKLHTKCMHVNADGQWSVILETDDDSTDSDEDAGPPAKKRAGPSAGKKPDKEIEVIDLLDDD